MWDNGTGGTRGKIQEPDGVGQHPRFQIHEPGRALYTARVPPVLNKPEAVFSETVPVPGKSPWDCLLEIQGEIAGRPVVVWESPEGQAFAGVGAACRIEASGPGRFEAVRARLDSVFDANPRCCPVALGGFSFQEQGASRGWPGFPDALFLVPERLFSSEDGRETHETRFRAADAIETAAPAIPDLETAAWDRPEWMDAVRRTLDRIREGSLSKAVLARSITIPLGRTQGALEILDTLRDIYPTCTRFLIDDGRGSCFLGASPERLVSLRSGRFYTEAVAGTQRCEGADELGAMERALLERVKDQREHEVVLRHILEALTPMTLGELSIAPAEIMRLPHLLHIRTRVSGGARRRNVLDYVERLHPTPAVAGWPQAEVLDWIRRVEPESRGWYAGCVGWVDGSREGDFAVGIRSIAIRGDQARVFAGAGIVEGSDPEQEWNETEIKMRGILDAIARD